MKPRCAAKAAAPVRAGTWWSTPPVWQAFPSPRAASNRRAAPSMTGRVRTTVDPVARRAATAAVDAVTGAGRADRAVRAVKNRARRRAWQAKACPTIAGGVALVGHALACQPLRLSF